MAPRTFPTELMVGGLYRATGIVILAIARYPAPHKVSIDYIVIANIIFHAAVMIISAQTLWQIILDVVFIGAAGILPLIVNPWGLKDFLRYRQLLRKEEQIKFNPGLTDFISYMLPDATVVPIIASDFVRRSRAGPNRCG